MAFQDDPEGVGAIPGRTGHDLRALRHGRNHRRTRMRGVRRSGVRQGHPVPAAQPAPDTRRHEDHLVPRRGNNNSGAVTHGRAPLIRHGARRGDARHALWGECREPGRGQDTGFFRLSPSLSPTPLFRAGGRDDGGGAAGWCWAVRSEYLAARRTVPGPQCGRPCAEQCVDEVLPVLVVGGPLG